MSKSSMGRRIRRFARKRLSSSAVQSVSPRVVGVRDDTSTQDPKPPQGGSEAVKPAAPLVRLYVSTMLDVAATRGTMVPNENVRER